MIVFIQSSIRNVIENAVCLHHTGRYLGLTDFRFLPLLLLFDFPLTCFSLRCPRMIAPLMIRLSKNNSETFDSSGELSPLASNFSPLFFVLLLTCSIWKWIASVGSSQFLILSYGKNKQSIIILKSEITRLLLWIVGFCAKAGPFWLIPLQSSIKHILSFVLARFTKKSVEPKSFLR